MKSAIDTNIISALWSREPANERIADLLFEAKQAGRLVICAPVYAELMAYPGAHKAFVTQFLTATQVEVDADLGLDVWTVAGEAYSAYAERRRKDTAGQPKRLLVDLIVGAHALIKADRLLTLDPKRYRSAYQDLVLVP